MTDDAPKTLATCAICRTKFDMNASAHAPFCSKKCRLIDLNGWFSESYSVPAPVTERSFADFERAMDEHHRNKGR